MKVSTILAALSAGFALAAPVEERGSTTCTNPIKRKEWRNMGIVEKSNFILSMKCLMSSPSKLSAKYPYSTNRFEDFLAVHQDFTPKIHWAGQFLPWHRAFLQDIESALRNECAYLFGLPYWETALDYANLTASPVFTGPLSLGGNGIGDVVVPPGGASSDGNCIGDGPFKNLRIHSAQGPAPATPANRCVLRYFRQDFASLWMNPGVVADILAQPTFETMAVKLEGDFILPNPVPTLGMHTGGHATMGGDMSDMFTSNADPMFYLFHANLDRVWAEWQKADPKERIFAVGLPIKPRGSAPAALMWPDAPAGNVTLGYALEPLKLGQAGTVKVAQMMDTRGRGVVGAAGQPAGLLCYEYV